MGLVVHQEQVAALRAHFVDVDEERRLLEIIQSDPERHKAYPALLYSAFREALLLRFPEKFTSGEVVRLVAHVRLSTGDVDIDPYATEVVIRRALGDERVGDAPVSERDGAVAQMQVLNYLVSSDDLGAGEIDSLIGRAKTYVEQSMV